MRNRFGFIIALLFISLCLINENYASFKSDSTYIKPFSRKFSARFLFGIKELSFAISNRSSTPKVLYKPNNGVIGGVGVSYRNILLSYYFKISGTQLNNQLYGNTSIEDYQINLTTRFFYISGFHRTYYGFYVSKPYDSYPDWEDGTPNPQRPDIKYSTKGVETIVNLNPNRYSLNASLKLTEQQRRSVFSSLVYASYSYTSISADSSLIPYHLRSSFFDGKGFNQSNFSGWTVMPGISYSLNESRWFFNPMIFSGIGYLHKELLLTNDETIKNNDYYFKISSRLNFGYNGSLFFAGAFIEWNEMFLPEKNLMIKTGNYNIMLMAGVRF